MMNESLFTGVAYEDHDVINIKLVLSSVNEKHCGWHVPLSQNSGECKVQDIKLGEL